MAIDILDILTPTLFTFGNEGVAAESIPLPWTGRTNVLLEWGTHCEDLPPLRIVAFTGRTNTLLEWEGPAGSTTMQQHRYPVRKATPQEVKYTFRDQNGTAIPLTDYVSVLIYVKRQGAVAAEPLEADFLDQDAGSVVYDGLPFTTVGEWAVQFVALDAYDVPLYGEPLRLKVVGNLADLSATELPEF